MGDGSGTFFASKTGGVEKEEEEVYRKTNQHFTQLVTALPSIAAGGFSCPLYLYNDWYALPPVMASTMVAQKYFQARPTDVLVANSPKTGTTWIKVLLFATINRHRSNAVNSQQALESYSPHECIPFLEVQTYTSKEAPDLSKLPAPRLFATRIPFHLLPASISYSGCKVVYLCRNPKDTFTSLWHFANTMRATADMEPWPLEEAFGDFRRGLSICGPYWEHVLGYWKVHSERPEQVLFVTYEELKADGVAQLKRLAEFVGCPFSEGEEKKGGVIDGILRLCAIENLSNLEVNRTGATDMGGLMVDNTVFYRCGVVGDWVNHLSPEMVHRLDKITELKFRCSGLSI